MLKKYMFREEDVTEQAEQARGLWFDPQVEDWEQPLADLAPNLETPLRGVAKIFHDNLLSARHTISLPFNMMFANVLMDLRSQGVENINQGLVHGINHAPIVFEEDTSRQIAIQQSWPPADEQTYLNNGRAWAFVRLKLLTDHIAIDVSHQEVLSQGLVLLWGYFEAFVGDLFIAAIKSSPRLDAKAIGNATVAQAVSMKYQDYLDTANWQINREDIHFNQLNAMVRGFNEILDPARGGLVKTALEQNKLIILMERRHKIVHKAGIVDQLYLNKTGEALTLGSKINLTPDYIAESLRMVRDTAITLLNAVDQEVKIP